MENYTLTETQKIWLKELYENTAKDFRVGAFNLHLMALGSDNENATQLEQYADEQREFAHMLEDMAKEI